MVQWLRICLVMQGTKFRYLVWEGPTCCGASSGATAPERPRAVPCSRQSHCTAAGEWPRLSAAGESHSQNGRQTSTAPKKSLTEVAGNASHVCLLWARNSYKVLVSTQPPRLEPYEVSTAAIMPFHR